jgi:hypothetical protein
MYHLALEFVLYSVNLLERSDLPINLVHAQKGMSITIIVFLYAVSKLSFIWSKLFCVNKGTPFRSRF